MFETGMWNRVLERIDELLQTVADQRERGDDIGVPAIDRNAKRVEDVAAMLEMNVSRGLFEEEWLRSDMKPVRERMV